MAACICSQCLRSFSGLTAFDRHLDTDYRRRPAVICREPASAGLVRQSSGRWGLPGTPESRERLAALRAR